MTMLSISTQQMESLRAKREVRLVDELFNEARGPFAERCKTFSNAQLRQAVEMVIFTAMRAGVFSDNGIRIFLRIALCWGLGFQDNKDIDWVAAIDRSDDEDAEQWIVRVHDIALATALRERRWTWVAPNTKKG